MQNLLRYIRNLDMNLLKINNMVFEWFVFLVVFRKKFDKKFVEICVKIKCFKVGKKKEERERKIIILKTGDEGQIRD